jgi:hypothetical protein
MVFDCGRMQQSVCNLVAFIPFILEQISCKRLLAETFPSPLRFRSLVKCKFVSIVHTVQLAGSQPFLLRQAISDKFNQ